MKSKISILFKTALLLSMFLLSACATGGSDAKRLKPGIGDDHVETGEAQPKPEAAELAAAPVKVSAGSQEVTGAKVSEDMRYVSSASLWVRKGPGSKFDTVRALKRGDAVEVLEKVQVWAKIGANEFVSEKYLSTTPVSKAPGS